MTEEHARVSLKSLEVFEAAARLANFTRASEELGISQPAVSLAIKNLESELGVQLVVRNNKGIGLTATGKLLADRLTVGFNIIHTVVQEIQPPRGDHRITLAVSTAVATWWLLPRIVRFKRQHPDIELRVITTDTDVDLVAQNIDLAITLGAGDFAGYRKWRFAEEEIYPVCSQSFLSRNPEARNLAAYPGLPLIHLEQRYSPRLGWGEWLARFGISSRKTRPSLQFSDYSVVLQAAIDGQGIAQGWKHIVDPLIAHKMLVRPSPESVRTDSPMYIIADKDRELRADVRVVKDWLLEESMGLAAARRP